MRHQHLTIIAAAIGLISGLPVIVSAQTIERVRLTDNDLNCTQIH